MFPAMHAMLGQWTPPMERSKLCGITYAGVNYSIFLKYDWQFYSFMCSFCKICIVNCLYLIITVVYYTHTICISQYKFLAYA